MPLAWWDNSEASYQNYKSYIDGSLVKTLLRRIWRDKSRESIYRHKNVLKFKRKIIQTRRDKFTNKCCKIIQFAQNRNHENLVVCTCCCGNWTSLKNTHVNKIMPWISAIINVHKTLVTRNRTLGGSRFRVKGLLRRVRGLKSGN